MAAPQELVALFRSGIFGSMTETGPQVEREHAGSAVDAAVFLFLTHETDEATKYTSEYTHLRRTLEQYPEMGTALAMQSLVKYGAEAIANPSSLGAHSKQHETFWERAAILTAGLDPTGELLGKAIVAGWPDQTLTASYKDIDSNQVAVYFKLMPQILTWSTDVEEAKNFGDNAFSILAYFFKQQEHKPDDAKQKPDDVANLAINSGLKYLAHYPEYSTHGVSGVIEAVDLVGKAKLGDHLQPTDLLEILFVLPKDEMREALVTNDLYQLSIANCIISATRNGYIDQADTWLNQINGLMKLMPDTSIYKPYVYVCEGLCLGVQNSNDASFKNPSYWNGDKIEQAFKDFYTAASTSLANPLPEDTVITLKGAQVRDYYQLLWLVRVHKENPVPVFLRSTGFLDNAKKLMGQVSIAEYFQAGFDLVKQVKEKPNLAYLVPIAVEVSAYHQPQSLRGELEGVPLWKLYYQVASKDDKSQILTYIAHAAKSSGIAPGDFADFCMSQGNAQHALAHLLDNLYEIPTAEVHEKIKEALDKLIADKNYLTVLLCASKLTEQQTQEVHKARQAFKQEVITGLDSVIEENREVEIIRLKLIKEDVPEIYYQVAVGILTDRQVVWEVKRALVNSDPDLVKKISQTHLLRLLFMEKPAQERIGALEQAYADKLIAKKEYGKLLEAATRGVIGDKLVIAETIVDLTLEKLRKVTRDQLVDFFREWLDMIVSRKTGTTLILTKREKTCLKKWYSLAGKISVLIGMTVDDKYKDIFEAVQI